MDKTKLIDSIIEKEWNMFHTVNGDDRTSCQDDYPTFKGMRNAQYSVWSEAACESYLSDIETAERENRNLAREKYIRMMKSTDPKGYEAFCKELPEVSEEKNRLVADIWAYLLKQTERMREKYPLLALGGRTLYAKDETGGWPSIETYQTCELLTYSEKTLGEFLNNVRELEKSGVDYSYQVQENTILFAGYPSMEKAETMMAEQTMKELGIEVDYGGCCCGGGSCS